MAIVKECVNGIVSIELALTDRLCADVQLAAVQEASLVSNRDEDGIPLLLLKLCQN